MSLSGHSLAGKSLSGKRILLILSGGIAVYKSLDLIRRLRERGAGVTPVMTAGAREFVTPLAVGALSATHVFTDLFSREDEQDVGHIRLARDCDLVLVAPATAVPEFVARVVSEPGDVPWPWLLLAGLKAGLLTFGGAYTAIPVLREDAVRQGWMGDGQFLDGLALSGVLPAPLIIFSTFVGYVAGGPAGALAITAGVFLPAFGFSLIFFDRLEAVVEDARLHALLEGVTAAVVGLIAATAMQLSWGLLAANEDRLVLGAILLAALVVIWLWRARIATPVVLIAAGCAGAALLA